LWRRAGEGGGLILKARRFSPPPRPSPIKREGVRAATLAAIALLALVAPAAAGEHAKEPLMVEPIVGPPTPLSDMMVDVQRVQAHMAQGDKSAYEDQRVRLKALGAKIGAAGPEAFKVKAERDAVVIYLLSGGQPRDAAKLADRGDFPANERELLRGAIGYALGRQADAEALLRPEPKAESLRLGSQLAYAQSVLLTSKDPKKALELLDLARLLSPGSLIEEAALRREILLVGDLRDSARVAFLARQYVERFGRSIYAGNFVQGLTTTTVRFDLCPDLPNLNKFSALLELVTPDQRRTFLLGVARASLLQGRFEVAALAAQRSATSAAASAPDDARARLYDAIARFPQMSDAESKSAFAAIDASKLVPADRDLLAAGAYVHQRLYEMPPLASYEDVWREAFVAAARSPDMPDKSADPATATIRRAFTALHAAEDLGKEFQP
jgi:chemotaxis protein MotC